MFDVQFCAQPVELMLPRSYPLTQAKEPVGELLAIVGENGACNSSLMSILYGYYQVDSGQILVFDNDVNATSSTQQSDPVT